MLAELVSTATRVRIVGDVGDVVRDAFASRGCTPAAAVAPLAVAVGRLGSAEWRELQAGCDQGGEICALAFTADAPHERLAAAVAADAGRDRAPAPEVPPRFPGERLPNVLRFDGAGQAARALLGEDITADPKLWSDVVRSMEEHLGAAVRADGTVVLATWGELVRIRK